MRHSSSKVFRMGIRISTLISEIAVPVTLFSKAEGYLLHVIDVNSITTL